jgi:hypothetical protein
MDVLNSEEIYESLFHFNAADTPFNDNFELYGVGDKNFLMNTGSLMIIYALLVVHKVVCLVLYVIGRRFYRYSIGRKAGMFGQDVNLGLELLKLTIEAYLEILLSSALTIYAIAYDEDPISHYFREIGDALGTVTSLGLLATTTILPIVILGLLIYARRQDLLDDERFQAKYAIFFEDYRDTSFMTMACGFFIMIRRASLLALLLVAHHYPHYQAQALQVLSIINLIYLIVYQPYKDGFTNKVEIFTEFTVYLTSTIEITFFSVQEDEVSEANFKDQMGWALIGIVGFNISVNLIILAVQMLKDLYASCNSLYIGVKLEVIKRVKHSNQRHVLDNI